MDLLVDVTPDSVKAPCPRCGVSAKVPTEFRIATLEEKQLSRSDMFAVAGVPRPVPTSSPCVKVLCKQEDCGALFMVQAEHTFEMRVRVFDLVEKTATQRPLEELS